MLDIARRGRTDSFDFVAAYLAVRSFSPTRFSEMEKIRHVTKNECACFSWKMTVTITSCCPTC